MHLFTSRVLSSFGISLSAAGEMLTACLWDGMSPHIWSFKNQDGQAASESGRVPRGTSHMLLSRHGRVYLRYARTPAPEFLERLDEQALLC